MPFHIPGSQMNGFPLPSSSHLSLLPSFPFSTPIFTLFRPASLNYCHGRATTLGEALHEDWWVGWERRGGEGEGDVHTDVMRGGYSCWHTSAWYMFTGVFVCVWQCVAVSVPVCVCDMPMGQFLATHHAVVATVWGQQWFDICEG